MNKVLVVEIYRYGEYYSSRYDILRSYGANLYFLTCSMLSPSDPAERVRFCAGKTLPDIVSAAVGWHSIEKFDGVLTLAETSVVATAAIAEALGLKGVGLKAARVSRNKLLMRQAHEQFQAPHPQYRVANDLENALQAAADFGYPVILKPTLGAASQFVFKINSEEQMLKLYQRARSGIESMRPAIAEVDADANTLLVEEFLDGREFLVEGWLWNGGLSIGSIVDRVTVEGDTFDDDVVAAPTSLKGSELQSLYQAVAKGVAAQGICDGVVHAEIRFHNQTAHIVEIAVRPGGGALDEMARISYGYCPLRVALSISLNKQPMGHDDLNLTGDYTAGMVLLCSEGRIERVCIAEDLRNDQSICFFKMMKQPGDFVKRPPNGNDILGFLCTRNSSHAAASASLTTAATKIQVLLANDRQ